jgi:hypothetical protein
MSGDEGPPRSVSPIVSAGGTGCAVVLLVLLALFLDILLGLAAANAADRHAPAAGIVLAGCTLLAGGAACRVRSAPARAFGISLMLGWAVLSIVSAGQCTGFVPLRI